MVATLLAMIAEPQPARALRDLAFDMFLALKPRPYDPATPVRVIDIDDESLRRIGQWPWPRTTLARLVKTLGDAGAAVVALDILLSEPDRTSLDQVIANMEASSARDQIERVWREGGADDAAKLRYAFRLCTDRLPDAFEQERLLRLLREQEAQFSGKTAAAVYVSSLDLNKLPEDIDLHRLAPWTMVARALLNLDETITKE